MNWTHVITNLTKLFRSSLQLLRTFKNDQWLILIVIFNFLDIRSPEEGRGGKHLKNSLLLDWWEEHPNLLMSIPFDLPSTFGNPNFIFIFFSFALWCTPCLSFNVSSFMFPTCLHVFSCFVKSEAFVIHPKLFQIFKYKFPRSWTWFISQQTLKFLVSPTAPRPRPYLELGTLPTWKTNGVG